MAVATSALASSSALQIASVSGSARLRFRVILLSNACPRLLSSVLGYWGLLQGERKNKERCVSCKCESEFSAVAEEEMQEPGIVLANTH